jgi:hypothetical protein
VTPNSNPSNATQGKNIADPTACESFDRKATATVAANPTAETATTARRSAKNRLVEPRTRLISIPAVIGAWLADLEAYVARRASSYAARAAFTASASETSETGTSHQLS